MSKKLWMAVFMALGIALLVAGGALAQDNPPGQPTEDEVNAIAKQLYCPVCENVPLDVCPTQACIQWRDLIREKLALGWSEGAIKEYFVAQYGDRVLATPPAQGFNWLLYILPPAAMLGGVVVLYRAFQSWKKPLQEAVESRVPEEAPRDEYIARLEEELRKR